MPRHENKSSDANQSSANSKSNIQSSVLPPKKRTKSALSTERNKEFDALITAACENVKSASRSATSHYQKLKVDESGKKTKQLEHVILIYPPVHLSDKEKYAYGQQIINYLKKCVTIKGRSLNNLLLKPYDQKEITEFNRSDNHYIVNDNVVAEITVPLNAPPGTVAIRGQTQYNIIKFFTAKATHTASSKSSKAPAKPAAAGNKSRPTDTRKNELKGSMERDTSEYDDDGEYDEQQSSSGSSSDESDSESEEQSEHFESEQTPASSTTADDKKRKKPFPPALSSGVPTIQRAVLMKTNGVYISGADRAMDNGEQKMRDFTQDELPRVAAKGPQPASRESGDHKPAAAKGTKPVIVKIPNFKRTEQNLLKPAAQDPRSDSTLTTAITAKPFLEISPATRLQPALVTQLPSQALKAGSPSAPLVENTSPLSDSADTRQQPAFQPLSMNVLPLHPENKLTVANDRDKPLSNSSAMVKESDPSTDVAISLLPAIAKQTVQFTSDLPESVVEQYAKPAAAATPVSDSDRQKKDDTENSTKRKREADKVEDNKSQNDSSKPDDTQSSTAQMLLRLRGTSDNPLTLSDDEKEFEETQAKIRRLEALKEEKDKKLSEVASAKKAEEDKYIELRNKRKAEQQARLAQLEQELAHADQRIDATNSDIQKLQNRRESLGK